MSKTIIIKTQAEFNALPASFNEFTYIQIQSDGVWICVDRARGNSRVEARGNSSVVARENSSVVARENSSVVARENSSVVARENSRVEAWGNSRVEAWGNSRVEARENSRVEAWGNSSVVAWGNSRVEARENSRVVAWENSRVEAWGNSSVVARGNSSVVARENSSVAAAESSFIAIFALTVNLIRACQNAIVVLENCKPKLPKLPKSVSVIRRKPIGHDMESFKNIHGLDLKAKEVTLYKAVCADTLTDFRSGKLKYEGTLVCPDWDKDNTIECGKGLHLCARPEQTIGFVPSGRKYKILECQVKVKDIAVYSGSIEKVRCKQVTVIKVVKEGIA